MKSKLGLICNDFVFRQQDLFMLYNMIKETKNEAKLI